MDCLLCGSPQGEELSPRGIRTVDRFLQQLHRISSGGDGAAKIIFGGTTTPPPRVCGDCLCDMTLATERAREVVGVEGQVRTLQRQLLRTTHQLQTLVGSFLEGMRPMEENAKKQRREGEQDEELHSAIINVVGMLSDFGAATASKHPATEEVEMEQDSVGAQDSEPIVVEQPLPENEMDFLHECLQMEQSDAQSLEESDSQVEEQEIYSGDENEEPDDTEGQDEEPHGSIINAVGTLSDFGTVTRAPPSEPPATEEVEVEQDSAGAKDSEPIVVGQPLSENEMDLLHECLQMEESDAQSLEEGYTLMEEQGNYSDDENEEPDHTEGQDEEDGPKVIVLKKERFTADLEALAGLDPEAREAALFEQKRKWRKVRCPACGKELGREYLRGHLTKWHGFQVQCEGDEGNKDKFTADFEALAGLDKNARKAAYKKQWNSWRSTKVPCPVCGKNVTRGRLKSHIAKRHDPEVEKNKREMEERKDAETENQEEEEDDGKPVIVLKKEMFIPKLKALAGLDKEAQKAAYRKQYAKWRHAKVPCQVCFKKVRRRYLRKHLTKTHNVKVKIEKPPRKGKGLSFQELEVDGDKNEEPDDMSDTSEEEDEKEEDGDTEKDVIVLKKEKFILDVDALAGLDKTAKRAARDKQYGAWLLTKVPCQVCGKNVARCKMEKHLTTTHNLRVQIEKPPKGVEQPLTDDENEMDFPQECLKVEYDSTTESLEESDTQVEEPEVNRDGGDDGENEEPVQTEDGTKVKVVVLTKERFIPDLKALAGLDQESKRAAYDQQHDKWKNSKVPCQVCGKNVLREYLEKHLTKTHKLTVRIEKPPRDKQVIVLKKERFILDREALAGLDKIARKEAHNKQYGAWMFTKVPCQVCGKNFARHNMKNHIIITHNLTVRIKKPPREGKSFQEQEVDCDKNEEPDDTLDNSGGNDEKEEDGGTEKEVVVLEKEKFIPDLDKSATKAEQNKQDGAWESTKVPCQLCGKNVARHSMENHITTTHNVTVRIEKLPKRLLQKPEAEAERSPRNTPKRRRTEGGKEVKVKLFQ